MVPYVLPAARSCSASQYSRGEAWWKRFPSYQQFRIWLELLLAYAAGGVGVGPGVGSVGVCVAAEEGGVREFW